MKTFSLRTAIFLSLCCDLGLFAKRLISPIANIITDSLHIPGGIGTSFSLMFLVIAVMLVPCFGCATTMSTVQSVLAVSLGMVGSMGALSPIGYILPGIVIDLLASATRRLPLSCTERMVILNAAAAPCAAMAANLIVFHLHGIAFLLYLCVSATSGAFCGFLGSKITHRLAPVIRVQSNNKFGKVMQEE